MTEEKRYIIAESQLKKLEFCEIENCDGGCPDCPFVIAEEVRKNEVK